jgi:arylsulfatase A-like enzyme
MLRPNILFILIDDMGWSDIGPFGSTFYETPHLDAFANESMKFTDAYAACPVCSPTRASILTGKYPARVGITNFIGGNNEGKLCDVPYLHYLPLEEKTIATALKEGGYKTYHVGKWHLGSEPYWPEHHGFDINIAGCDWGAPRTYFSPYGNPRLKEGPAGEYLTDRLTDEAIRLIHESGESPFFMYFSHYAVHIPIQSPPDLVQKYQSKAKALGLDQLTTFEIGEKMPFVRGKDLHVRRRLLQSDPGYAAMIENLDTNIGRLLNALERSGKKENTIVIFFSDNGGLSTAESSPTCNAPLSEGKGWMYEGGTREPLLIRWPGKVPAGTICNIPVTSTDFYPTFLEAAGLPLIPDQHCDGKSILPLLRGETVIERDALFWHYPHYSNQGGTPGSSIRMGEYKLIECFEDKHVELYNLANDIGEKTNLAETFPEITRRLLECLHEWQQSIEAKIPPPHPDYPHNFSPQYSVAEYQFYENEEGIICTQMHLTPTNPELYEIPIAEILEEYLETPIELRVRSERYFGILHRDDTGNVFFDDSHLEKRINLKLLLQSLLSRPIRMKAWQMVDPQFQPLDPPRFLIAFE